MDRKPDEIETETRITSLLIRIGEGDIVRYETQISNSLLEW